MNSFNWQWWQYFCAIAEQGSLSAAAAQLNVSQPTLSRQLQSMETQLGQTLFDRSTQGLVLTAFGASLMQESQHMQLSAERLQRLAHGQTLNVSGRVRLSVNEMVALYYLPQILPAIQDAYPQLSIEIDVSNRATSLDKRDADVAVRMFRPTQLDLVARHLLDIPLGLFAHPGYLQQHGIPAAPEDLLKFRILGYDRDPQFEQGAQALGWQISNKDFLLRTDFMPLHIELARQQGGIVATHRGIATHFGLQEILPQLTLPQLPVYLVCHRDVQHNRAIRVVMDQLAAQLPNIIQAHAVA